MRCVAHSVSKNNGKFLEIDQNWPGYTPIPMEMYSFPIALNFENPLTLKHVHYFSSTECDLTII